MVFFEFRNLKNEKVLSYAPSTEERIEVQKEYDRLYNQQIEIPSLHRR